MGYGGYVSAKLPPPKPTEVEAALMAVKSMETMELIHKLSYNAACSPNESKFRRVRLSNPKIKEVLADCPGALEAMEALGWAMDEAELVIPSGKYIKMDQVRQQVQRCRACETSRLAGPMVPQPSDVIACMHCTTAFMQEHEQEHRIMHACHASCRRC